MKKKLFSILTLLAITVFALAEMAVYVYKKDGTEVEFLAANVDSIGFVNVHIITFDANGGSGSMDVIRVKDGETITLPINNFTNSVRFAGWNVKADGTGVTYADGSEITITSDLTLYAQWEGFAGGHEWVDLGLPSGTKWATCNVGANSSEEFGYYFAWGETEPKEEYDWSTYKWSIGYSSKMTKYCTSSSYGTVDNKTTLELTDDAAYVNWGSSWRMPTLQELDELKNTSYTTWTWTTKNGVNGYIVTGPNGYSIFFPVAGFRYGSVLDDAGAYGSYWSSSLNTSYSNYAYYLSFDSDYVDRYYFDRYGGRSVRPVLHE